MNPAGNSPDSIKFRKLGLWTKLRLWFHKLFLEPLVYSKCPPWYDARAVSLGLITGFLVPVGGHLVTLAVLRAVCRFNYLIAFAFTFVSNPLDMIPLYYGYYHLGSLVLGRSATLDYGIFEKIMHPIMDNEYFWQIMPALIELGHEIFIRWILAAVILSAFFGTLGYVITFKVQKERCKRAADKLGQKYEKYVEELETQTQFRKF
jgi:uncharacterized protein